MKLELVIKLKKIIIRYLELPFLLEGDALAVYLVMKEEEENFIGNQEEADRGLR